LSNLGDFTKGTVIFVTAAQIDDVTGTVNDKLTGIQLDLRELSTNLKNFHSDFERLNTNINEIKQDTKKALELSHETKTACALLGTKVETHEKEILTVKVLVASEVLEIKTDQKEKDREAKADRKWLIGTIIVVVGLLASNINTYL
jgi:chromosome segregation ATPase